MYYEYTLGYVHLYLLFLLCNLSFLVLHFCSLIYFPFALAQHNNEGNIQFPTQSPFICFTFLQICYRMTPSTFSCCLQMHILSLRMYVPSHAHLTFYLMTFSLLHVSVRLQLYSAVVAALVGFINFVDWLHHLPVEFLFNRICSITSLIQGTSIIPFWGAHTNLWCCLTVELRGCWVVFPSSIIYSIIFYGIFVSLLP